MKLFISAGEPSGDMYAGMLIEELCRQRPDIETFGMGGDRMKRAGANLLVDIASSSVVGISEVARQLPEFFRKRRLLNEWIAANRPDVVVIVDFPDFNIGVAEFAQREGVPVVSFIPPKAWAWRPKRGVRFARVATKIVCVLPFAADFYRELGANVEYVGHPLIGLLRDARNMSPTQARTQLGLKDDGLLLGLLPGSRRKEVAALLPEMLGAAEIIRGAIPSARFVVAAPSSLPNDLFDAVPPDIPVVRDDAHRVMRACDALIAKSGTVTLEAGIVGTPMVVVYRLSALTYAIVRRLATVQYSALPNLLAGREICPELYQHDATAKPMADAVIRLLTDDAERERQRSALRAVADGLGDERAIERAAAAVLSTVASHG